MELTCEKGEANGRATAKTVPSITGTTLTYSGCHLIVFGSTVSTTVNTNGRSLTLYASGLVDIVCTVNISGIKYSHSGFTCGNGSGTTGTYTGSATAIGHEGESVGGTATKIWWE